MDFLIFLAISFILGFMIGWFVHKHEYGEISDKEYFRKLDENSKDFDEDYLGVDVVEKLKIN